MVATLSSSRAFIAALSVFVAIELEKLVSLLAESNFTWKPAVRAEVNADKAARQRPSKLNSSRRNKTYPRIKRFIFLARDTDSSDRQAACTTRPDVSIRATKVSNDVRRNFCHRIVEAKRERI